MSNGIEVRVPCGATHPLAKTYGRGRDGMLMMYVTGETVRVWDDVAGHYVLPHPPVSPAMAKRARYLATYS